MLFMWGFIIAISAICGFENPVYFGAGFCIGYIIHSLNSMVDSVLAEAIHEIAEEMRLERENEEKENNKNGDS